ncbi:MAG: glycosyltransferase family 2 protein [Acidobacteria bacterium]|nr:glycosyltransferase family 2 protein [Acidobacteriota bacterium]
MQPLLVSIVTYQSAATIVGCLESLLSQTFRDFQVVVVDNASCDGTVEKVGAFGIEAIKNQSNVGFCSAHNQVIARSHADFLLVLNPDVQLAPDFIQQLLTAMRQNRRIGTACGKLLRLRGGSRTNVIDSAGMVLRRNQRHLDRGAGEIDCGQYDGAGFIFGASGAAALYRQEFIEDVSQGGEFFDPNFFSFREDADLSWRGQWLGWNCLYWPAALGWHARRVTPERRRELPPEINYHSVKNRFLMRIKNLDGRNYLRHFLDITCRDLGIFGYVLLRERTSLSAFKFVLSHYGEYRRLREDLRLRRRVGPEQVGAWFDRDIKLLKSGLEVADS